jgi:hypothetical protein
MRARSAMLNCPDDTAEWQNFPDVYVTVARPQLAVASILDTYDHPIHLLGGSVCDGCHPVWVASHADDLGGRSQFR